MSDSEERKTEDSRTINIEIPAGSFEGMFRMMTGRRDADKTGSGCCETTKDMCCPESGEDRDQEIKIVIKKKEK